MRKSVFYGVSGALAEVASATPSKGRVFHTPPGHDVKALSNPAVGELLRRGTAWAAGQ